jgi:hypothetical protein
VGEVSLGQWGQRYFWRETVPSQLKKAVGSQRHIVSWDLGVLWDGSRCEGIEMLA